MAPKLEKDVEHYLVARCAVRGILAVKFIPDQRKGMPDRLLIRPRGRVTWVETKRPKGGRLSEMQKYQHGKLRARGHDVRVVATRAEVDALMDELTETEKDLKP